MNPGYLCLRVCNPSLKHNPMAPILSIRQIAKAYGPVQALKGISFDVPEGSVFGVLGPNGSGKTTLLGILLDVLQADGGSFAWFGGIDHQAARRQIGSLLETPNFYHYLSAVRNLEINAAIKGRGQDDIGRVLDIVKLSHRKDSKFSTYSLGMKQRLAIANALLGRPRVLLLDEPTNGLDPEGIAEIRELIRTLNAEGITVIMASHLLDEVEKVCTHAAILKEGALLLSGDVAEIFRDGDMLEVGAADLARLQQVLQGLKGVQALTHKGKVLSLVLDEPLTAGDLNRYCFEQGIVLSHLSLKQKSLEARFMELTR
ncbi:ABC-2 type transport system ATP-binding protein [Taibaiella chishuiensis]|uniref:ABC-2 type transport system ATP-binding protein n=2 Tax=Taibaiella chishuiensis TaxID=1434707 RepID=A0A2P8CWW8_9BACT|nr:ABC-2 type transport system ATP-binding protein [Taibaiella chishuiensis]